MTTISTDTERKTRKGRPFGGKNKLYNIVPIQFRTNYIKHDADARELHLRAGDEVVVETTRGPTIATVTGPVFRKVLPLDAIPRVLRKANEGDTSQAERNEAMEVDAYRFGIERIRARKLPMKMIRAQFLHDGSKIVFYFSAEGRIDFRDLVKDLAHRFRTRIEMHQIGVRDGARMLGGIGPCGRELCCSTFLDNFEPVSIRMAKDQGLTLNPKKVSGMCGRLMCCLVYEQAVYRSMRTRLPRAGQIVSTEFGEAKIIDVDVINRRASVQLADNNRRLLPVAEIQVIDPNKVNETVDDDDDISDEIDYIWDDGVDEGFSTSTGDDLNEKSEASAKGPERSRRRRSRQTSRGTEERKEAKKTEGEKANQEKTKPDSKSGKTSSKSSRSRRRRQKRRSSASGKGNAPATGENKAAKASGSQAEAKKNQSRRNRPKKDQAKKDQPKSDRPKSDQPKKDRNKSDQPKKERPHKAEDKT